MFSTTTILEAFAVYAPKILTITQEAFKSAESDLSFTRLSAAHWVDLPDISIDYAVMERAPNITVVLIRAPGPILVTGRRFGAKGRAIQTVPLLLPLPPLIVMTHFCRQQMNRSSLSGLA